MSVKLKSNRVSKPAGPAQDQTLPQALLAGESDIGPAPVLLLAAASWVLSLPMFAPWGFWPAGFVVFVPWLLGIALSRSAAWAALGSYLLGAGFYLMHFRWLAETTVPGYLLASLLYLGPLFPLVGWVTRHLHKRRGLCLAFAFPLLWAAQELAHSRGPLAFPWFLLGHSQYRWPSMIQAADLAGVYGLSLILAAVNGAFADRLLHGYFKRQGRKKAEFPRQLRVASGVVLGAVSLTLLYGQFRLRQHTQSEGPKIAVVQGDFPLVTWSDPRAPTEAEKRDTYLRLAREAVASRPELVVLPETPWAMFLNARGALDAESRRARSEFQQLALESGARVVVGAMGLEFNPDRSPSAYPRFHRFNSAYVFEPRGGEPARYDKIHLVLFGEYVPFRYSFYRFYRLLNDGPWNPWGRGGREYSLTAGQAYATFGDPEAPSEGQARFGVTICYEDVIPQVFRRFILDEHGRKRADYMLNISNDGWFGRGTQQAQHLVNCAFRAVENRVGIARSVNTGISGFIRPDGSMHDLVQDEGRGLHAGGAGYRTARVMTDSRVTLYSRYGDLLPAAWSIIAVAAMMDAGRAAWTDWRGSRRARRGKRKGAK